MDNTLKKSWKNNNRKEMALGISELNKITCKVCGYKMSPSRRMKYTVTGKERIGGIDQAINGKFELPELYDAIDCPICGCQAILKERLRKAKDV